MQNSMKSGGKRTLLRITAIRDMSLINKEAVRVEDKHQPYMPQIENVRMITNFTKHYKRYSHNSLDISQKEKSNRSNCNKIQNTEMSRIALSFINSAICVSPSGS